MRVMPMRRPSLILTLLALPTLAACGSGNDTSLPPPSETSMAAIAPHARTDKVALARAIDRLFDEETVGETRALLVLRGGTPIAERYGLKVYVVSNSYINVPRDPRIGRVVVSDGYCNSRAVRFDASLKYLQEYGVGEGWESRGRAGLAGPDHGRPHSQAGAAVADADAGGKREDHWRLHCHLPKRDRVPADRQLRCAGLAPALVRTTCRTRRKC